MGPRYTAATGQNLVEGYKALGKFQYYTYIGITVVSMFIFIAAITLVTGGIVSFLIPIEVPLIAWSAIVLFVSFLVLLVGRYNALDKSMKIIVSFLTIFTFIAVLMALFNFEKPEHAVEIPSLTTATSIAFIVAFMGWMPIPLDAAIWHSIWTKEKSIQTGKNCSLNDATTDFNLGYISASFIAVLFFTLGVWGYI